MADATVLPSADIDDFPSRVFGEAWYQQRWEEASANGFAHEGLAKAESILEAALGVADALVTDVDTVDHNEANAWPKFEAFIPRTRNGLGMALRFLLEEASMQMAKTRGD